MSSTSDSDLPLDELRNRILDLSAEYARRAHAPREFDTDDSHVPASGKLIGEDEMRLLVDSSLDFWLTTGRFNDAFEKKLGQFLGRKHVRTVNSGSSANLVALSSLFSHRLGNRALKQGDEMITVAAGFPTTVNPALQWGLKPVFIDVDIPTYNIDASLIEDAITERTRVIMIAHTLGNPFDLNTVTEIAERHDLWLVEDCCDALGSRYDDRKVGTFGDVGTLSFYPAHHITMGEGGAVFTQSGRLRRIIESMRDWGRDCWCEPGADGTCNKRYGWKLGDLPQGYDHKYTYSHAGYNLKITDMQAAVGLGQLDHVEAFIEARKRNFRHLHDGLADLREFLILPEATANSEPAWFGFPLTLRTSAPFSREDLLQALNRRRIHTRLLFAGNLIRQPYMREYEYRVHGDLTRADQVMVGTFWIGVQPALSDAHIDYSIGAMHEAIAALLAGQS